MSGMVALTTEQVGEIVQFYLGRRDRRGRATEGGLFWGALMAFMFLTGARVGEAVSVTMGMIAGLDGKLHAQMNLPKAKSKPNAKRLVRIDAGCDLARVVEAWIAFARRNYARIRHDDYVFVWQHNGGPVSGRSAWRAFQRAYVALMLANVPHGTHGVRKSAGIEVNASAKEMTSDSFSAMEETRRFYAHSTVEMTKIYTGISEVSGEEIARRQGAAVKLGDSLYIHAQGRNESPRENKATAK